MLHLLIRTALFFLKATSITDAVRNTGLGSEEMRCEQTVKNSGWLNAFTVVLDILTFIVMFYSPAFPLALPDFIFNFQEELEKEKREERQEQLKESDSDEGGPERSEYESLEQSLVYLDDPSPITCSALLSKFIFVKYGQWLPDLRLSFNIKLAFLLYCVIPLFST